MNHWRPSSRLSITPSSRLASLDVALERALVLEILAGELVEEADLPEHRADAAHLEMHPLDRLVSAARIVRAEACRSSPRGMKDRAGLEQRRAAVPPGPLGSRIAGILPFGLSERNSGALLVVLVEVDEMRLVGRARSPPA